MGIIIAIIVICIIIAIIRWLVELIGEGFDHTINRGTTSTKVMVSFLVAAVAFAVIGLITGIGFIFTIICLVIAILIGLGKVIALIFGGTDKNR